MGKKGNILVILLMGTVIVLSLGAAGYLFLQNRQLQNQLVKNIAPVQTPTSVPNPVPIVDPTASWKAYTNSKYQYSIKYPPDYAVYEVPPDYVRFFQGSNDPNLPRTETYLSIQLDANPDPSKNPAAIYKTTPSGKVLRISQIMVNTPDSQKPAVQAVFDQILSTFKFL